MATSAWTMPHSSSSSLRCVVDGLHPKNKVHRLGAACRRSLVLARAREERRGLLCEQWGVGSSGRESRPSEAGSLLLEPAGVLLQQRIVFLGSQVDDVSADLIISQLLLLDAKDPTKDIKMFINSPGGSVSAGMGIYDAMKLCRADVSTICFGLAASMGAFLLASGTKGKRYCMPNARVMIHQPLGGAGGVAIDVGIQVREMMYHKAKLNKILSRLTGKSEEQIEADTDRDYFMNAWEAVDYGLVDGVIDDGKPGLVAPIGEAKEPPKTRVSDFWTIKDGKKNRPSEDTQAASEKEKAAV
ncbi:ATP-dependent Clp protease proteolytic subunit 3, chloroplastic [Selaginella moellendorffii]|uniref:ATP-dependent Clp protease proteolytic subunit 3, chloroplastic n=1 Tax=Selaginella moellendorffii TaxID=88036 RepID=UPI000D1CF66D|nr:ATP-dependent Clp protease proteolytic subunit 3, chloroplastic [Selaginella moellendorffii]|eukprot:XP_002960346.2 ATP-dependent Clp protease proteolytic subunit 3, chloroplastic [Selaginella moellendorffii]